MRVSRALHPCAGLLAENAIYRDIVVEYRGLPAVMEYANVRPPALFLRWL